MLKLKLFWLFLSNLQFAQMYMMAMKVFEMFIFLRFSPSKQIQNVHKSMVYVFLKKRRVKCSDKKKTALIKHLFFTIDYTQTHNTINTKIKYLISTTNNINQLN